MKKISSLAVASALTLLFACTNESQTILITGNAVGKAKVGMSVAQIREAIKPLVLDQGIAGFEGDVNSGGWSAAEYLDLTDKSRRLVTKWHLFVPEGLQIEGGRG